MPRNASKRKVFTVAFVVALVCSSLVTLSTLLLRPVQEQNRQLFMQTNILKAAGLWRADVPVKEQLQQLEMQLVVLGTTRLHEMDSPEAYDQSKAVRDPKQSVVLTAAQDIAGIKRRAHYAPVYMVRDDYARIEKIILPVYGAGLWSSMYGFLALERDMKTVIGIRFYEHGETPGLGGEVDSERWLAKWQGKQALDEYGDPAIKLIKGGIDHSDPKTIHQIDSISGATLTNRSIENLVNFWLGDDGFGPILTSVKRSGGWSEW